MLGTTTLIPGAVFIVGDTGFRTQAGPTLFGPVTGSGMLEKYGNNGTFMVLASGASDYSGGTLIHGGVQGQAPNMIASSARSGTPFGSGAITVRPGGGLRVLENSNIAANPVTLNSDGFALAGLSVGYSRGALPTFVTSGSPSAGQVLISTALRLLPSIRPSTRARSAAVRPSWATRRRAFPMSIRLTQAPTLISISLFCLAPVIPIASAAVAGTSSTWADSFSKMS